MYIDSMQSDSILTPQPTDSKQPQQPTVNPSPTMPVEKPLVKPLTSKKFNKSTIFTILGSFVIVVLGVATGWFLAGKGTSTTTKENQISGQTTSGKVVDEAGIGDESSYATSVEGTLKEGGIKGEGTHYIDRGLGESKYVYLTSSVVDLDSFVDKKVTVWGETISAKYASWMVDVGKIKVTK